jgi:DNA-binding NarL/FixJ family response regulator
MGSPKKKRTTILIVDDHPIVREALATRIGWCRDLKVCGEAADMIEGLRLIEETQPDLVIVDISLKSSDGIELIKRIKSRDNQMRTLVWSMYPESLYAERALRAGALGYISKDQAPNKILDAIRRVLAGKIYLSDEFAERLLHGVFGRNQIGLEKTKLECLADRELEVFRLIGAGVKTAEIAERLHLSKYTIETYRERIRRKLGLPNGTALAHFATQCAME